MVLETMTDAEITERFSSVEDAIAFCRLQAEAASNARWGDDDDPELETQQKAYDAWMRPDLVEFRKSVVLSTCHVHKTSAEIADRGSIEGWPLTSWEYGYLAYCSPEPDVVDRLHRLPEDLKTCCRRVNANVPRETPEEAIYIFFDRDGPVIPDLPQYDW